MTYSGVPLNTGEFKGCYLPELTHGTFKRIGKRGLSWDRLGVEPLAGHTWRQVFDELIAHHTEFCDFFEQMHANLLVRELIQSGFYVSADINFYETNTWELTSISGTTATLTRRTGDADPFALGYVVPNPLYGEPDEPATITIEHRLPAFSELNFTNSAVSGTGGIIIVDTSAITASVPVDGTFTVTLANSVGDTSEILNPYPDTGDPVLGSITYYTRGWHQYTQPRRIYPLYTQKATAAIEGESAHVIESRRIYIPSIKARANGADISAAIKAATAITQTSAVPPVFTVTVDLTGTGITEPVTMSYSAEADSGAGAVDFPSFCRCGNAKKCPMRDEWYCGARDNEVAPEGLSYFPADGNCYQPGFCSQFAYDTPTDFYSTNIWSRALVGWRIKATQIAAGLTDVSEQAWQAPSILSLCGPAGADSIVDGGYHIKIWYFQKGGWAPWWQYTDGSGNEYIVEYEGHEDDASGHAISPLASFTSKKNNYNGTARAIEQAMALRSSPTVHLHDGSIAMQADGQRYVEADLSFGDWSVATVAETIDGTAYVSKLTIPRLKDLYQRDGDALVGGTKFSTEVLFAERDGDAVTIELLNRSEVASSQIAVEEERETTWLMGGTNVAARQNQRLFNYRANSCVYGPRRDLATEGDIARIDGRDFHITACAAFAGAIPQTIIPASEAGGGWTEETYYDYAVGIHGTGFSRWADWADNYALGDTITVYDPEGLLDADTLTGTAVEIRNDAVMLQSGLTLYRGGTAVSGASILVRSAEGVIYGTESLANVSRIHGWFADDSHMASSYEFDAMRGAIEAMNAGFSLPHETVTGFGGISGELQTTYEADGAIQVTSETIAPATPAQNKMGSVILSPSYVVVSTVAEIVVQAFIVPPVRRSLWAIATATVEAVLTTEPTTTKYLATHAILATQDTTSPTKVYDFVTSDGRYYTIYYETANITDQQFSIVLFGIQHDGNFQALAKADGGVPLEANVQKLMDATKIYQALYSNRFLYPAFHLAIVPDVADIDTADLTDYLSVLRDGTAAIDLTPETIGGVDWPTGTVETRQSTYQATPGWGSKKAAISGAWLESIPPQYSLTLPR